MSDGSAELGARADELESVLLAARFDRTEERVSMVRRGEFLRFERTLPSGHAPQVFCIEGELILPMAIRKRSRNGRQWNGTLVILSVGKDRQVMYYKKRGLPDDDLWGLMRLGVTFVSHVWDV